jgi:hypothetical protein
MQGHINHQHGLSSSKLIAMLNSSIVEQQVYALKKLNHVVDF